ncbi:alcohol dehydrogenase catalytic domain-containing protein [Candidatus Aminicenantes bacterium AC-335-A11]|jgi:threonine dehydrogenase-like Zn-dependent dehydrogenase|nr:alcohol dehydrogenase catalytic domain-containing protein [SCandidatus Aminicenantes bacterium Aminicenantia_JdfR_composite]MCP2596304.1 alcohol dehydrogenase catalytic domain-containing protein [Candidatus Aminicenantes bacterium AC-335-G13]MCP2597879.1 alcohol dehydrogenase catalytic domain-containing protein [Candidatus Aminicenantes bacterium AC-335-L06]MCP2618139.1 alcohol dehydrogenase catalytic domain-containing protein [Candidatus Aminicenantes bacterium AC-335-A11]MCP2620464.1 alcoh
MKALVFKNNEISLNEVPIPEIKEDEALIKILKAGICNTDIEILKGYMNFEGILGHEFVGIVVEAKNKKWIGKRVVGEINIGCGKCEYCLTGRKNHCPSRKVVGILNKDGAFAEYITLPISNLYIVPDKISDEKAVFTEPLAAALRITEQIEIRKNDKVLIIGDGKIGLLISQVMKLMNCETYCMGKHKRKLKILENKNIKTLLKGKNIDHRFDIVIEAAGKRGGIKQALKYVKPEGKVILKSTYHGRVVLDISSIVVNEINVTGSRCGPFNKALELLERNLVEVESLIDGEYSLCEWEKAFEQALKSEKLKILFRIN